MPKITYIEYNGRQHVVEVPLGSTIMRGAVDNGIPGIDGDCGGQCACATCYVFVDPAWLAKTGARSANEEDMLGFAAGSEANSRLGCQIEVTAALDGLVVRMVPETRMHAFCRRIGEIPKPFIAAINGTAMGGGFEVALACDIRLVQDGPFSLGLPEVNIGLLPGGGGTQRLTLLVGQARALELMLLGRTFSPREAVSLGIASECVDGPVLARALQLAMELGGKSPLAIAHIKRLVRGVGDDDTATGFAAERTLFCELMSSQDGIARMEAMNSGRKSLCHRWA